MTRAAFIATITITLTVALRAQGDIAPPSGLIGLGCSYQTVICAIPGMSTTADYQPRTDTYYKIVSKSSGKVLDVTGGPCAQATGTKVQIWSSLPGDNQSWRFIPVGDSNYRLVVKHSGQALDVEGGPGAVGDGARIQQYDYLGGLNQKWQVIRTGAGTSPYVYIRAAHSGRVLDVQGGPSAVADGTPLQQYAYWGGNNQQWQLIALNQPLVVEPSIVCR